MKLVSRHNLWGGVAAFGDPGTAVLLVAVQFVANKWQCSESGCSADVTAELMLKDDTAR